MRGERLETADGLFTKGSHHRNLSIIYLVQKVYEIKKELAHSVTERALSRGVSQLPRRESVPGIRGADGAAWQRLPFESLVGRDVPAVRLPAHRQSPAHGGQTAPLHVHPAR